MLLANAALRRLAVALTLLMCVGCPAYNAKAQDSAEQRSRFYATVYGDIWSHGNLTNVFGLVQGNFRTDPAYFVSAGLGYRLVSSFVLPVPFCDCRIDGLSLETE